MERILSIVFLEQPYTKRVNCARAKVFTLKCRIEDFSTVLVHLYGIQLYKV